MAESRSRVRNRQAKPGVLCTIVRKDYNKPPKTKINQTPHGFDQGGYAKGTYSRVFTKEFPVAKARTI
jgi:hypothetical protein